MQNDPQQLLDTMLAHNYTEQEFRHSLALVQTFLESRLFEGHMELPLETKLAAFFGERQDEAAHVRESFFIWGTTFFDAFTAKNLYETLKAIERNFEALPAITLYVPIELPRDRVVSIGVWLRQNTDPKMITHLVVEPDMAAGCALVKNGVHHDFSFRYFLRKHEQEMITAIHEHTYAS